MSHLLLSQEYLKNKSIIDPNTSFDLIRPTIEDVQDFYIKGLLGSDLFDEILEQAEAGTLTEANEELLNNYILRIMLLYLNYELPKTLKYKYSNKGIMLRSGENSQNIDANELKELRDEWKNKAETYSQRMLNFIRANATDYPAFYTNSGIDKEYPKGSAYDIDIFLPDTQAYESPERGREIGSGLNGN